MNNCHSLKSNEYEHMEKLRLFTHFLFVSLRDEALAFQIMFAINNTSTPDVKSDTGVGIHCPFCWVTHMGMNRVE